MANNNLKLRDRDGILTRGRLNFPRLWLRLTHQTLTYATPSTLQQKSSNPKTPAPHEKAKTALFYKFYNDEGMKLVAKKYPQYMLFHEMIGLELVGIKEKDIVGSS